MKIYVDTNAHGGIIIHDSLQKWKHPKYSKLINI